MRTWNVFHGNAWPSERRAFLEPMVRLAVADAPDLVCLQELPVWSLRRLERWSGMVAVSDVTMRPRVGSAEVGRVLTDIDHGRLRSALTGQANAVLVARTFTLQEHGRIVLNPWSFRRRHARRLGLSFRVRLAWGRERRVCQVLRVVRAGRTFVVGNLHASGFHDERATDAELLRAATFVDGFARPGEAIVLAGDFNVTVENSLALADLAGPGWDLQGAAPTMIDHVLARGLRGGPGSPWPVERRTFGGRVLSDHAPVDRELT